MAAAVRVETEDGACATLLSSDLSINGIRLVGPSSLLGKKLRVTIPTGDGNKSVSFSAQIVWSSAISQGLYENGGAFLGMVEPAPRAATPAKVPEAASQTVRQPVHHEIVPTELIGLPVHPRAR